LPQLTPDLVALAGRAVMRACWALMLRFGAPVDLPFDAAFVNQGPLRWIARNSSKPGRSGEEMWLLHARAEWSERIMLRPHDRRHDLGSAHAPATAGSLRPPRFAARPGDGTTLLLRGLPCAERQHGLPQRPRSRPVPEIA
jgi:predicted NAD/FAD-dependent oxidoreductase